MDDDTIIKCFLGGNQH